MPDSNKITPKSFENEKNKQKKQQLYNDYVKQVTPKANMPLNILKAFTIGGAICVLGQFLNNLFSDLGADKELASAYTSLSLIFLSILATGLNLYQKLATFAGAGTVVPITGFANSVASPAIEYKKEGQVFGIGCKIFTIAGPVILYGIFSSWVLGVIYLILKMTGILT